MPGALLELLDREDEIIASPAMVIRLHRDAATGQNLAIGQVGKGAYDRIR